MIITADRINVGDMVTLPRAGKGKVVKVTTAYNPALKRMVTKVDLMVVSTMTLTSTAQVERDDDTSVGMFHPTKVIPPLF